MKRIAIITGMLTIFMLTATAQRHERSERARNSHHREGKAIRRVDKQRSHSDRTTRYKELRKQRNSHHDRTLNMNHHDKKKKRNNHVAINRHRTENDYRSSKNGNNNVRGYYSRHYKINDRRHPRDGNINHHHHKRWKQKNHYKYPARPRIRTYWRPSWNMFYVNHFPHFRVSYVSSNIATISGRQAKYHVHEVKNVFGKVYETYYSRETNEFFLYLGDPYPFQDFTIVMTGQLAEEFRRVSHRYFIGENFMVSGYITAYDDKPEMIIRYRNQLQKF